jgi:hypothetical protein
MCSERQIEVPSCWEAFWVEEYLGGDPSTAGVLFGPLKIRYTSTAHQSARHWNGVGSWTLGDTARGDLL